ncbi:MAG: hypothetical protein ABFS02_11095, partial [Pseudomonadota bacterium]
MVPREFKANTSRTPTPYFEAIRCGVSPFLTICVILDLRCGAAVLDWAAPLATILELAGRAVRRNACTLGFSKLNR